MLGIEWESLHEQKKLKKLSVEYVTTLYMHLKDNRKEKKKKKRRGRIYKSGANNASKRKTKNTGKKRKDEPEFTKKVPMQPRYRLKRLVKKRKCELLFIKMYQSTNDELGFVKKLPQHPRDRLRRQFKKRSDELEFVKQIPQHPRDRLK